MATARLTDAQARTVRSQALRALRRKQRAVDTAIEVFERKLDRAIENKERITIGLIYRFALDFKVIYKGLKVLDNAMADTIQVFLQS